MADAGGVAGPSWRVRADVDPRLDLVAASSLYSGLFGLVESGEIRLSLRWKPGADHFATAVEVQRLRDDAVRRLVFDIHDRSYDFSERELQGAEVYFKRCYYQPDVDRLEGTLREKVRPLGPVFAVGTSRGRWPLVAGALAHSVPGGYARTAARNLWAYLRLPPMSAYAVPAHAERPARVLLQTRLWTDAEVTGSPSAAEINAERAELVRALRKGLGERFVGGIIHTPLAEEFCPDLICSHETHRSAYLATMHQSRVGIYTQGLHHSTAWKLGEYIASSLCIVADGLRNSLPQPLREGRNVLTYSSAEGCLEHCQRLLDDPEFAYEMSLANEQYYREQTYPPALLKRCFEDAFGGE